MQATLETLGNLERRLSISVPFSDIEAEVQTRLRRVAKTAKIHGFRPGKAPIKIVEQHYGFQVREEAMNAAVERGFSKAVQENNLKVAGFPQFAPAEGEQPKDMFAFQATFEVFPEVKLKPLADVAFEKATYTVGDADVEKTLEILRKQRTRFNAVSRPVANGDRTIIDFEGKIDGVVFDGGVAQNFAVWLGEGQMLPDFEKNLIGLAEGESRTFDLAFPADYHGGDVAGKTAQFTVTIKSVAEAELPALDAEFAKLLGIGNGDVALMKDEVKKNVEREVARRLKARIKEGVLEVLLNNAELDLPKALISVEINRMVQQARSEFASRGIDPAKMPIPTDAFAEQAKRRVALGLILAEVVKANELKVKPETVRAIVEDVAASYEDPQEVIDWYYADAQRMESPNAVALEDTVVEWVLGQVKSTDKAASFDELMGRA